jgi:gliding motility-associated-like protein
LLYTYQKSGLYTIFLKFETLPNCFYEATKSIEIYPLPKTGFDFFPNETDILNANIEFIDKSVGATKYQYEISDSSLYTDASFFHQFSDSGTYEIKQILTSKNGCEDSIAKMLKVHFLATTYIPNAFSPNNNDINEAFKPIGLGMKSYQMKIYNRWGQLIFDGAKNQAWNGKKSPLGVYQYQIRTESYNGEVKYLKGTVKLLR